MNYKFILILSIRRQILMELLSDSPLQNKELLLVGVVPLLCLSEGSTGISHGMISPIFLLLRQHSPKAFSRGIRPNKKVLLKSGKASIGACTHFFLRISKALRASGVNITGSDFLSYRGTAILAKF